MIPKSVSATSLTTATECLSRYKAENINYARGWGNPAALNGTTCHSALQDYVELVYVKKTHKPDPRLLTDLYELHFLKNFGANGDEALKDAGLEMMEKWSAKEADHMDGRDIVTLEQKKYIILETSAGQVKLNYILDRLDYIGDDSYEVIDYKSSIHNTHRESMRSLLQPLIYALATYIEHPEAKTVFVTYDMLRFDLSTIEVTKEDARAAFDRIMEIIEEIIATPEDNPPETLNKSCNYCIRKATCATLQKNIDVGGLFALSLDEQIDLRTQIELQLKGLKALQSELDSVIEPALGHDLMLELKTKNSRAYFTTSRNNIITSKQTARMITGDEIYFDYAKVDITLDQYKKLLKDDRLTDEQRAALKGLMAKEYSDPKLKFENLRGEAQNEAFIPELAGKLTAAAPAAPIMGLAD